MDSMISHLLCLMLDDLKSDEVVVLVLLKLTYKTNIGPNVFH